MIKINRSEAPDILIEKCDEWTVEYLELIEENGNPPPKASKKYGHEEIRELLETDAYTKCMYCESKISHVSYPNVEHIAPKSKYPEKIFEWENLGLACQVCNTCKGTKYHPNNPPIDPYDDDPSDHVYAFGETLRPKPGSDRGKITIRDVDLNRAGLIEARNRRLNTIQSLSENYKRASDPETKEMFLQELCIEARKENEYKIFVDAMLRAMEISCED